MAVDLFPGDNGAEEQLHHKQIFLPNAWFCLFFWVKEKGKSGEKDFNDAANKGFSILIIITKSKSSNFPFYFNRLKKHDVDDSNKKSIIFIIIFNI